MRKYVYCKTFVVDNKSSSICHAIVGSIEYFIITMKNNIHFNIMRLIHALTMIVTFYLYIIFRQTPHNLCNSLVAGSSGDSRGEEERNQQ